MTAKLTAMPTRFHPMRSSKNRVIARSAPTIPVPPAAMAPLSEPRPATFRRRERPRDPYQNSAPGARAGSCPADVRDASAQRLDQPRAFDKVLLLGIEDQRKSPLLERRDIDPVMRGIEPRRIADDVDQPIDRVHAAQKVVVLAIGARQKGRKVPEP